MTDRDFGIDPAKEGSERTVRTIIYPSGAKAIITEGPGWTMTHLECPYHSGDIYSMFFNGTGPFERKEGE